MLTKTITEMLQSFKADREVFFEYIEDLETKFSLHEPKIQAFIPEEDRFKRLRAEAAVLYKKYPNPDTRPNLFGLMIGVKDIYFVDGFSTHAGSKLPAELFRGQQAQMVTKLRTAGALVLGKTVTTEFAYFSPGPTRNPHNLAHTPGGSSSGSAAAIAAGLAPFTTGTQTIGSISRPASYCGVIGFKPSYGRLSTLGVIPLSPSVDHTGFFTKDATSALFIAEYLIDDWNTNLYQNKKPVLGIPTGAYLENASKEMLNHFKNTCQYLAEVGYSVKNVEVMKDFEKIKNNHNTIVAADAYAVHKDWYEQYRDLYHPKTVELLMRGKNFQTYEFREAMADREKLRNELSQAASKHGIDLWLSPAAPGPAPKGLDSTGDPVMNLPWTYSGVPTICLNSGETEDGLPLGLQISGTLNQDEALLNWATKIEQEITRRNV